MSHSENLIPMDEKAFTITREHAGIRLDQFLQQSIPEQSRSFLQSLVKKGLCTVDGVSYKANYRLKPGEKIIIEIPEEQTIILNQDELPLTIIHRAESYVVIEKPAGLLTHPGPNDTRKSVAGILSKRLNIEDSEGWDDRRPGIVHRLDKDTSGLLIVALNSTAKRAFTEMFKSRKIQKGYRAVVRGLIGENRGEIDAPIGRKRTEDRKRWYVTGDGRASITPFRVIKRGFDMTEVEVTPKTGRTHQIRVHFQYIGHPIINDPLYARKKFALDIEGQLLCAEKLGFICPETNSPVNLSIPPDSRFEQFFSRHWKEQKRG